MSVGRLFVVGIIASIVFVILVLQVLPLSSLTYHTMVPFCNRFENLCSRTPETMWVFSEENSL